MKKIKVQLDFNITRKIHSLYHSFFKTPPEGIEYLKSEFKGINDKTYSKLGNLRKKLIRVFPPLAKLQTFILSVLRKESEADLIHFTFHLGKTNKKCVIDYEHSYNFFNPKEKSNKKLKKKLIKNLNKKNIKFLMPIHQEALKSFKLFFGDKIKKPQEVIYPTIFIPETFRKKIKKEKLVVFISTSNILNEEVFLIKGGFETYLAFKNLAKKYPGWKFLILGEVPQEIKEKTPKNLVLKNNVPREEMWKIFNKAKIFVQPCYQAPAMAFLEAMWFKLPIITYSCWGNTEFVDSSNGIVINPKEINHVDENNVPEYPQKILEKIKENSKENSKEIEKAIKKLMKNEKLTSSLGEKGFNRVSKGKFSIENKNKKLKKIYDFSLK